jgi:hypothetical protein
MTTPRSIDRIQALAYRIWEDEGRPEGRHEQNWMEAERRLEATDTEGLEGDVSGADGEPQAYQEDTRGRPKSASSRQQTQPNQVLQSGSGDLDRAASGASRRSR